MLAYQSIQFDPGLLQRRFAATQEWHNINIETHIRPQIKTNEYAVWTEMLFADFQQMFESIKRRGGQTNKITQNIIEGNKNTETQNGRSKITIRPILYTSETMAISKKDQERRDNNKSRRRSLRWMQQVECSNLGKNQLTRKSEIGSYTEI